MIKLLTTIYFCLILVQERLGVVTIAEENHNEYFASQRNQAHSAMLTLNSHQLTLNNLKSRFRREIIITSRGKYNYDGKDFYDAITNKKIDEISNSVTLINHLVNSSI